MAKPPFPKPAFRQPVASRGAAAAKVSQPGPVAAPVLVQADPTLIRPCAAVMGESGTGKTWALLQVLRRAVARGETWCVLAVEPKIQQLLALKPLVAWIGLPVKMGSGYKKATGRQKYQELMAFADKLASGGYREHEGRKVKGVLIDGMMEMGDIVAAHKKATFDRSKSLIMWDEIGIDTVDLIKTLRDAAGMASGMMGLEPLSIIATVGEKVMESQFGEDKFVPALPGKIAGRSMPYQFEAVVRLSARMRDGIHEYVAHTVKTETFYAKAPSALWEPEVINPNFGEMFDELVAYYQGLGAEEGEKNE